ncbi:MAG TPA: biotin--[acetyl-CoA-carboxylase] ligase [Methanothrix sp.]|nr:biotin--[acetyl-CoA-carboxylase] ligase [Methanothrix sp.]
MDILSMLGSGEWVSGEEMARRLSISRSAVWKQIQILRRRGYAISSSTRKGYRLTASPDLLNADQISGCLKTEWMGKSLRIFESVPSTNALALSLAKSSPHGAVILAETQLQGRGRLSRTWASPPGGIWMSLILKPQMPLSEVARINMAVSVALCRAISAVMGIDAVIKWPNDILVGEGHAKRHGDGERKVCGILTEMKAEVDMLDYMVVGVGLNANVDLSLFPEDWRATSLAKEAGRPVPRAELICRILEEAEAALEKAACGSEGAQEIYQEWRSRSATLNRRVRISAVAGDLAGMAADLASDGALVLEMDGGERRRIVAGDCIHLRPADAIADGAEGS